MLYLRVVAALLCVGVLMSFLQVEMVQARDTSGVLKASQLIGMTVEGIDGKKLGSIKDLVVDPDDGAIDYAVLDFGRVAGIGDKYFAVLWEALQFAPDQNRLLIDVTKKELKDAPGFDKKNWPDLSDRQQVLTIYEYDDVPLHGGTNADRQGK